MYGLVTGHIIVRVVNDEGRPIMRRTIRVWGKKVSLFHVAKILKVIREALKYSAAREAIIEVRCVEIGNDMIGLIKDMSPLPCRITKYTEIPIK